MNVRHGDLGIVKIKALPKGLEESKTNVMLAGSHGHNHTVDKGKIYLKKVDDFVYGYLVAKDTTIQHEEHGDFKLPNGAYELRRQVEFTPEGLIPVID